MNTREKIATGLLNYSRSVGRMLGAELIVDLSSHSIKTSMEQPDETQRAWDPDLYRNGQVYYQGYANPIKPTVDVHKDLDEPDTVDIEEGDVPDEDDSQSAEDDADGPHVEMMSSPRYRKIIRQDLISQLLTPRERWRLIAYVLVGIGVLQFVTIIVTLWATGTFQ